MLFRESIPAYPNTWLFVANGWFLLPSALLQLNMMNTAVASNDMAVTVPLYSSAVLIFTIVAGSIYFGEAAQMSSLPAFAVGTGITIASLLVLASA